MTKQEIEKYYTALPIGEVVSNRNGRIMIGKIDKYGYRVMCLSLDSGVKHIALHRIIALCLIENVNNLPQVNHKDGNKLNCSVHNLEWVSAKENTQHAFDNGLARAWNKGKTGVYSKEQIDSIKLNQKTRKPIMVTNTGIVYSSVRGLCSQLNLDRRTVQRVLEKKRNYNSIKGLNLEYA